MNHLSSGQITRRAFSGNVAGAALGLAAMGRASAQGSGSAGIISGEPTAEKVGQQIFNDGGNAVDAIVAAALTAAIVAPHQTGLGGYGGHATLSLGGGRKITSFDFNSSAPAAARTDMFPLDASGKV